MKHLIKSISNLLLVLIIFTVFNLILIAYLLVSLTWLNSRGGTSKEKHKSIIIHFNTEINNKASILS